MRYESVTIDAFGYELAPNVLTSDDIEDRLAALYQKLHLKKGQLETLTGIRERRYWDMGFPMNEGAMRAGLKALISSSIPKEAIGMLIYAGVCRDQLEPATACAVAHGLNLGPDTQILDVSNACLGVLNGMILVANAIELGQIDAGMVVSCETSREIIGLVIHRLLETLDMNVFKQSLATLTGGSGAVAVILSRIHSPKPGHRLLGGVVQNASQWHRLCQWGPDTGFPSTLPHFMQTDSVGVLQNGVKLGIETYSKFRQIFGIGANVPDKVICHQVGSAHQKTILSGLGIPSDKDFTTFEYLGNMGTVSLPMTAAIADEREFLQPGDRVGFLGIGSGLNCLMLAIDW
ncbi:MAG: 3-oxoacyl-ACP synthase III [Desulfatirhabdiaceae bacterium]